MVRLSVLCWIYNKCTYNIYVNGKIEWNEWQEWAQQKTIDQAETLKYSSLIINNEGELPLVHNR